ncbi:hypothetical protein GUITHDRAFT_104824 [Guillardia theta CCMP2712]|uniref:RelA/SpoT domain-containing protein n=2 Tax=Guillardia theta TaxID=55529 RepID=L1JM65_GUITC|nr:hypothetical protein GUITHDRAFT_104824 [Guillardia theta CCMP2712]EKX49294.1 hypothetical protein GUITHDRAFT_104824 [Guillardia theta CCMP2712]|mmetsp:Transcript_9594/g.32143  ORF Transcript_9594/g.32143 Transcript_9594/m.32143 type:complete len:621 (+) Transcript_9594:319-2181(+)|eukprot:XP_005836274.1 hypothetical protein GUITHDRAFT_104824 [Guillardia theta CCMP2712]
MSPISVCVTIDKRSWRKRKEDRKCSPNLSTDGVLNTHKGSFHRKHSLTVMDINHATKGASGASLFYCSRPLEAALTRRPFQLIMLVLGGYSLFSFFACWSFVPRHDHISELRFITLTLRGGDDVALARVGSFGALLYGKELRPSNASQSGAIVSLQYEHTVSMDGWYFTTSEADKQLDPIRFRVEAYDVVKGKWKVVGSSSYLVCVNTYIFLDTRFRTNETRGFQQVFQVQARSAWPELMDKLVSALCFFIGAFAAAHGRAAFAANLAVWTCLIHAVDFLFLASQSWLFGTRAAPGDKSTYLLVVLGMDWVLSFVLLRCLKQEHVARFFQIQGFGYFVLFLYMRGKPTFGSAIGHAYIICSIIFYGGVGISIPAFRSYELWRAKRMIQPDVLQYEELWRRCLNTLSQQLDQLGEVIRLYESACSEDGRQYVQSCPTSSGPLVPVKSLEELYSHNEIISAILRSKVLTWAARCDGLLHAMEELISARDCEGPEMMSLVRWSPTKKKSRVVEKAFRLYHGDLSKVLDVVRECIIFNRVEDLKECIEEIFHDEDIEFVRIKNRLSKDHCAQSTGGYRDVLLNLRLRSFIFKVVEVQLILREFSELKSDEGHARYVQYRNCLCS